MCGRLFACCGYIHFIVVCFVRIHLPVAEGGPPVPEGVENDAGKLEQSQQSDLTGSVLHVPMTYQSTSHAQPVSYHGTILLTKYGIAGPELGQDDCAP